MLGVGRSALDVCCLCRRCAFRPSISYGGSLVLSLGAFSFGRVCLGYVVCRIAEFGEVDSLDMERICIDGIDGVSEVEDWEWNMG